MNRHHVSAGSFYIGREQPLILEAFLGTCVGVCLADPTAGVGGLAHFLLPEPTSLQSTFQPEKYASTGMPLFLNALYEAGARSDGLKATIAGGALVGPVDDMDLNLNIGGRTAEIAEALLRAAGIPIEHAETGGFFSCCLRMDMNGWGCRIEPSGIDSPPTSPPAAPPSPAEINRSAERLLPVPQVALKIMRLVEEEEEYDIRTLAAELRKDQVISARTLRLANSVMFATYNRIESIDHALMFLGVNLLMKLVISAAVEAFFDQTESGYSLCKGGLYHHAVGTAVIAEKLAQVTASTKPGLAYSAGLLHDIGKVALDQFMAGAYPLFYRKLIEEKSPDFTRAEQDVFGTTHTEIGRLLAERWSFPESLQEAIAWHHQPERSPRRGELSHVVYLANLLMARFHTGLAIGRQGAEALAPRLAAIGLSSQQLPQIVDLIPLNALGACPESAIGAK
jgi:putative nucleotidyltransferase with HDIG domain